MPNSPFDRGTRAHLHTLRMFPTLLKVGFASVTAYRAEVVIWILATNLPFIMYGVWSTIAAERAVGGFDESTFASYFVSIILVRQITSAWVVWELNFQIRSGKLSTLLLRPAHPLLYMAAENLAALPYRVLVILPILALSLGVLPELSFTDRPALLGLALVTAGLGWLLTFAIQALIGLLALYTEQSLSFQDLWFGLWALLSGYMIPLELMPWFGDAIELLPFRAQGFLAAEIAIGRLSGDALLRAVGAQLAWLLLALGLLVFLWPRAMRRFEAYGN